LRLHEYADSRLKLTGGRTSVRVGLQTRLRARRQRNKEIPKDAPRALASAQCGPPQLRPRQYRARREFCKSFTNLQNILNRTYLQRPQLLADLHPAPAETRPCLRSSTLNAERQCAFNRNHRQKRTSYAKHNSRQTRSGFEFSNSPTASRLAHLASNRRAPKGAVCHPNQRGKNSPKFRSKTARFFPKKGGCLARGEKPPHFGRFFHIVFPPLILPCPRVFKGVGRRFKVVPRGSFASVRSET